MVRLLHYKYEKNIMFLLTVIFLKSEVTCFVFIHFTSCKQAYSFGIISEDNLLCILEFEWFHIDGIMTQKIGYQLICGENSKLTIFLTLDIQSKIKNCSKMKFDKRIPKLCIFYLSASEVRHMP